MNRVASVEKLYTVNKNKTGADCGSDHELLIAKFRLKLKKVGKTTRPYRPDTPGSPEGNTEGPGTASSEPLLPS